MTDGSRELIIKNWQPQSTGSNQTTLTAGTAQAFPASNAAGIGAMASDGHNRTRFCEVYNDDAANTIYAKLSTTASTGSGTNAADYNSRPIPPKSLRIFQVPQGGQGIVSCMAKGGNCVVVVNWGIGR